MGLPIITTGTGSRYEAITDLIQSVALQETAISHILNAEGEKIQAMLAADASPEELLELTKSVYSLISSTSRLEMILQAKLELFADEGF
ncbi:MAG: hypothetical protein LBV08_04235, partial [Clostridiales bacterium]|nr:hypothetical protein [Clostridiales bacterium]